MLRVCIYKTKHLYKNSNVRLSIYKIKYFYKHINAEFSIKNYVISQSNK